MQEGCLPAVGGEFVAAMEDVLDLYAEPRDHARPVVCFDESPKPLIGEVRAPLSVQPGAPRRVDREYERCAVRELMMFCEPKRGWREFAHGMRHLVELYPDAEVIRVVFDNLHTTHTKVSLYEAFAPEEARTIARKLEFHFTPKHGSWLNIAEIELAVLSTMCLSQRLGDEQALRQEVEANVSAHNVKAEPVKWRFTNQEARRTLARLYPPVSR